MTDVNSVVLHMTNPGPQYLEQNAIFEKIQDGKAYRANLYLITNDVDTGFLWSIQYEDADGNPILRDVPKPVWEYDDLRVAIRRILSRDYRYIGYRDQMGYVFDPSKRYIVRY